MTRIACALPIELERGIVSAAERHGHDVIARTTGADELAQEVAASRPATVIVLSSGRYLSANLLATCDLAGTRVVALVADDAGRRHATSLSLFETADATSPWSVIESMLEASTTLTTPSRPVRGEVIAVWGAAGAPGRTSVAIAVAAELAALGFSVALADVDTHGASIAPALGMLDEAPGFAAACRLAGSDSLTRLELERISQRYLSAAGAFWVLTGIGTASRWPELSAEKVAATIRACREWVDFTVLDTSSSLESDEEISSDVHAPRRNAATVTAVREADRVVAVGLADPVGLSRFLRAHTALIETVGTTDVIVVMNRVRASAIGMNPNAQVTHTLARFAGLHSPVLVAHDQSAFDGAVLSGKTVTDAAPRSPARMALRDLAARLAPPPSSSLPQAALARPRKSGRSRKPRTPQGPRRLGSKGQ